MDRVSCLHRSTQPQKSRPIKTHVWVERVARMRCSTPKSDIPLHDKDHNKLAKTEKGERMVRMRQK